MTEHLVSLSCAVNGRRVSVSCVAGTTALELLRNEFALHGVRDGCGVGECGACTVLVDGVPTLACLLLAAELDGRRVVTIEGTSDARVERMRRAFLRETAFQCGFCTPGMILSASRIENGATEEEIRQALVGHACRCTGYSSIVRAVRRAHGEGGEDA
jgi:carbon-monoxide dehydrogenase small subunit